MINGFVERIIDDVVENVFENVKRVHDGFVSDYSKSIKMNVYKRKLDGGEIEYKLVFLVGTSKDNISVSQVDDNTIEVEIKNDVKLDDFSNYQTEYIEFNYEGNIKQKRRVVLPNINDVKQEFKNGLLIITVRCGKRESKRQIILD